MKAKHYKIGNEDICIPIAESYSDCIRLIKSDRYRLTGKIESTLAVIVHCLFPFGPSMPLFWLRMSQYKGLLYPLCRLIYKIISYGAKIDIPPMTRIGYGFYIGHGYCVTLNGDTIVGNNVNLSQYLNIGSSRGNSAVIGNKVYIGPMVSVVDEVKIGSNSTIGAGAVVTKDVPQNATVVGVPAKVINYNQPAVYIGHQFPCDTWQFRYEE
jgi:serine O-acetyltransferase